MTLTGAIEAARSKLEEASFFLGKLRQVEAESANNLADAEKHFEFYLSAFLSAGRSVPQILKEATLDWNPINAVKATWPAHQQSLARTLTGTRNLSVHRVERGADSTIEYIPESQVPRPPRHPFDGHVFFTRPPGVPEPRRGVRRFTIQIDGRDEPATNACNTYLGLMARLVDPFAATLTTATP
jgi:hypothetical protein